jgi:hypothetical protein
MRRRMKPSRTVELFLGATFCFLLSACGLPTYIYLYPPTDFFNTGSSESPLLLELDHDSQNYDSSEGSDQSFRGYEIYYKVYDSETAANSAVSTLSSQASTYYKDPDSFMTWANGANYVRLRNETTNVSPLISLTAMEAESDQSYYVNLDDLDVDVPGSWTLYNVSDANTPSAHIVLRRNISETSRSDFQTASNYHSGDEDYTGSNDPSKVYFVLFAVAYGYDVSNFSDVYSVPAYITSWFSYTPSS